MIHNYVIVEVWGKLLLKILYSLLHIPSVLPSRTFLPYTFTEMDCRVKITFSQQSWNLVLQWTIKGSCIVCFDLTSALIS